MRNNLSKPLDWARVGRVLPERNVSSHFIIIAGILHKNSSKVLGVDNDQMISVLAPDRPDQAFTVSILPGRPERDGPVANAHSSHAILERDKAPGTRQDHGADHRLADPVLVGRARRRI